MIRKITLVTAAALCLCTSLSQAQGSRLVSRHLDRFNTSWVPYDSVTFTYPNGAGGDANDFHSNRLPYDTAMSYGWNGSTYVAYIRHLQGFDTQGRITERITQPINGTTITNQDRITYTRDGNGNIIEEVTQYWLNNNWLNVNKVVRTFDGNNNMLTFEYINWNTNTNNWEPGGYLTVNTYNGNNNVLHTVNAQYNPGTSQYDSSYRNEWHYTNNLEDTSWSYNWSGGWQISARTMFTYNGNNVNTWFCTQNRVNNAWVNSNQNYYLFNTNNEVYGDSLQMWDANLNNWENYGRSHRVWDGNNNMIEYLWEQWDSTNAVFENNFVDSYAYNNFNQTTWSKRQTWDTANDVWTGAYANTEYRYYYEPYTVGVASVTAPSGSMQVYPSPAVSQVSVKLTWNKPQDFKIAIYDMQGRLLRQWGEKAIKDYTRTIPLTGMAPGTYILQVKGKDATMQEQFVILQ